MGGLLDEFETTEAERLLADPQTALLGYDEALRELVVASRSELECARQQKAKLVGRLRDWYQASAVAVGAALGYGLLTGLTAALTVASDPSEFPPTLQPFFVIAACLVGAAVGLGNGFAIGIGLLMWRMHPLGRIAPVVLGALGGLIAYGAFIGLVTRSGEVRSGQLAIGVLLGAGLGLGAASSRNRAGRLVATTVFGGLAMGMAIASHVPTGFTHWGWAVAAGLALGLATGLGLYVGAAPEQLEIA
jgi:hypothetical protein